MTVASFAEYGAGAAFGSALFASGVYSPAVISAQLNLSNFHMVKSFMTASASSAIIMYIADRTQYATMKIRTPQNLGFFDYDGNLVGGAMIGVGMALTGACPGTVLVQSGISSIESGHYALFGGVLGGLLYVIASPYMRRMKTSLQRQPEAPSGPSPSSPSSSSSSHTVVLTSSRSGSPTIHATFNLSPLTVLIAWEVMCLMVIYLASRFDPTQGNPQLAGLTTPVLGGLAIGAAQATSVFLNRHAVGCSMAYQNVGRFLQTTLKTGKVGKFARRHLSEPSVLFALGIISASSLWAGSYPPPASANLAEPFVPLKALAGGAVMAFGASVAGGCTSGHGISGLVTFSFASFVSVAAMFGAGIATALMIS